MTAPNADLAEIHESDPRVLRLAQARQNLAHRAMHLPAWHELTEHERTVSLLDARNYLRAAAAAGLLAGPTELEQAAEITQLRSALQVIKRRTLQNELFEVASTALNSGTTT